jgi:hypothetical protein
MVLDVQGSPGIIKQPSSTLLVDHLQADPDDPASISTIEPA